MKTKFTMICISFYLVLYATALAAPLQVTGISGNRKVKRRSGIVYLFQKADN